MTVSAGVDVGGSSVKAWLYDSTMGILNEATTSVTVTRRAEFRVEVNPKELWLAVLAALNNVLGANRQRRSVDAIIVTSLRQGFVLVDGTAELGPIVMNSDRRGEQYLPTIRERIGAQRLYDITGHWLAPELTLPKILFTMDRQPELWAQTRAVLFVHDWLVWRLCGVRACEASFACAGQLADVQARDWARPLMTECDIDVDRFPPVVEAGQVIGVLTDAVAQQLPGLEAGTPVVSGGADTQMAALGIGGARAGVVTVVAGSSTPVQAATESPLRDPLRRPWISTHLEEGRWVAETNVGYPGTMMDWLRRVVDLGELCGDSVAARGAAGLSALVAHPHWTEEIWCTKPPTAIIGIHETTSRLDLARAFVEAHAFGIRSNIEALEAILPWVVKEIMVIGGGASMLSGILADVLNRPVTVCSSAMAAVAARGGATLVARALRGGEVGDLPTRTLEPRGIGSYDDAYELYLERYDLAHRQYLDEMSR